VHKSPELAWLQVEAGAIGVCTATVWEAVAMLNAGIEDVLVANELVGRPKLELIAQSAGDAQVTVAIDDLGNLEDIAVAARDKGVRLGVLVDVDVGMNRCGVRSYDEALRLAELAASLDGVDFRGVMGYEGHCMLEADRDERIRKQRTAIGLLVETVDRLAADGHPSEVVSGGGTGTYDLTGANPRMTEVQADSYVVMDAMHERLISGFEPALTATQVSAAQRDRIRSG
jgi:D-serine deaminase-like pyridoxal phosphate-dependent protein